MAVVTQQSSTQGQLDKNVQTQGKTVEGEGKLREGGERGGERERERTNSNKDAVVNLETRKRRKRDYRRMELMKATRGGRERVERELFFLRFSVFLFVLLYFGTASWFVFRIGLGSGPSAGGHHQFIVIIGCAERGRRRRPPPSLPLQNTLPLAPHPPPPSFPRGWEEGEEQGQEEEGEAPERMRGGSPRRGLCRKKK